jgi:hypothetical protein
MDNHLSGFSITNTGSSPNREGGRYPAAVRVYRWGVLLACVEINTHQPLKYVRERPRSRHTQSLIGQLVARGVDEGTIRGLLQKNVQET